MWDASARAPSPLTEPRVLVRPNAILSSMIATREASNPIRVKCCFTAAWRIENYSWEDRRNSFFFPYFFLIAKQIRESLAHLCLGKLVCLSFTVGLDILYLENFKKRTNSKIIKENIPQINKSGNVGSKLFLFCKKLYERYCA